MIRIKRVYDPPAKDDGMRVLVDRVWPRGLSRDRVAFDEWMKDLAPRASLRKWFAHKRENWTEFCTRYSQELRNQARKRDLDTIAAYAKHQTVTLLYSARDRSHNQAVALAQFLQKEYGLKLENR